MARLLVVALLLAPALSTAQPMAQQMQRQAQFQQQNHYWHQYYQNQQQASASELAAQREAAARLAAQDAAVRADAERDWWGAVAVDVDSGQWFTQLHAHDEAQAQRAVMEACTGNCFPVLSFANTCIAPAYSGQGGMFLADGGSKKAAGEAAVAACRAAGGEGCSAETGQSYCTGWKHAYSMLERFNYRTSLVVLSRVKAPRLAWFPGSATFLAAPPGQRGAGERQALGTDGARPVGMARASFAFASSADGEATGLQMAPTAKVAADAALKECGKADCTLVLEWGAGACATVVRGYTPGRPAFHFGAEADTEAASEEAAVLECMDSDYDRCPVMLRKCF